jgi:alpha-mannosidase
MNENITMSEAIDQSRKRTEHLVYRIRGEIEFARKLASRSQVDHPDWTALAEQGEKRLVDALQQGPVDWAAIVAEIEALLEPLSAAAQSYTMHCVGHAHIDMNWMWSWPETVAVTNDTFTTVLALMEEYPEFCFSQSQASVYAILEEHNPALLARVAEKVREGRWEVTASHWVEGDKNMASGESLCRHLLYTRKYMKHLFGLAPEDVQIDWSP